MRLYSRRLSRTVEAKASVLRSEAEGRSVLKAAKQACCDDRREAAC